MLFRSGEGERVLALQSRKGTRASRRVEEGLSRSFSGGGGKPSFPSPSVGDIRELARVPLRGEGSCGGGGAPRGPMDCSLPHSSVHGISQVRILEWAAISSCSGIFLTQGSNPSLLHLLHWQVDSLPLAPGSQASSPGKQRTPLSSRDRKSTRLNSSHTLASRMPSSA